MIECSHLYKIYGNTCIIYDLSWRFEDSGLYIILGESGSGKTTFLNILYGILPFESGKVIINGTEYSEKTDIERMNEEAEYIDQFPEFVPFLSVRENLMMVCDDNEKIDSILEKFDLKVIAGHYPQTLSGGEKQRLAIIRGLLRGKKIIFLDEPTAALDEENKKGVFDLLSKIKSDTLILCSTHDPKAKEYADKVMKFEKKTYPAVIASPKTEKKKANKRSKRNSSTRNAMLFLKKRPVFKNKTEGFFLYTVLIFSFLFVMFADMPQNKVDATRQYTYHCNMLRCCTFDDTDIRKTAGRDGSLVVFDYQQNVFSGASGTMEGQTMELIQDEYEQENVITIPYEAEYFYLSDRLFAGTYYTGERQIILTREYADSLMPSRPEKLIGKTIKKAIKGLGITEFEIVGILDELSEEEEGYLYQYGIEKSSYKITYFINSRFSVGLEDNDELTIRRQGRREKNYQIYYSDYKEVLDAFEAGTNDPDYKKEFYYTLNRTGKSDIYSFFEIIFLILLPVSVMVGLLSILFFIRVQKLRYIYDHHFISVFERCGYDRKRTIWAVVLLQLRRQILICLVACGGAYIVATLVNLMNDALKIVHFRMFTFNWIFILSYLAAALAVVSAYNIYSFRRVKVQSWYEDLLEARDLI